MTTKVSDTDRTYGGRDPNASNQMNQTIVVVPQHAMVFNKKRFSQDIILKEHMKKKSLLIRSLDVK